MSRVVQLPNSLAAIDRYANEAKRRIELKSAGRSALSMQEAEAIKQERRLLEKLQERRRVILASWRL